MGFYSHHHELLCSIEAGDYSTSWVSLYLKKKARNNGGRKRSEPKVRVERKT
jgi:hypothetical protein